MDIFCNNAIVFPYSFFSASIINLIFILKGLKLSAFWSTGNKYKYIYDILHQ